MSLTLNSSINTAGAIQDKNRSSSNVIQLQSYLTVLNDNRRALSFVPDDAIVALDMVGFVYRQIHGDKMDASISAKRLALNLVQTISTTQRQ